jgi:peptidoglycan/xylan/chitin deacetylase (PgdA/CDA1 family)
MRKSAIAVAAFAAALACTSQAYPADNQLAYFQTGNIFHSGLRGTHTIALTFDDGPNENTRDVLAVLRKYNIRATFFIVGTMARRYPDILRQIAEEGHLLANHSATHPKLGRRYARSARRLIAQIREVHDEIAPYMKEGDTLFFRAPYGYWRSSHARVLNADPVLRQYVGPIYWDVGGNTVVDSEGYVRTSADWDCWHRGWTAETCAKGYLREIAVRDGGVVLMHSIKSRSGALVEAVVPTLMEEGYKFVRLDEVSDYDRFKTPKPQQAPVVAQGGGGAVSAHAR